MRKFIKYYKDVPIYYDDEIASSLGWIIETSPNTKVILTSPYMKELQEAEGYIDKYIEERR